MTDTKKRYGYTGQGLRINLTTGKVSVEPTFPRFDGLIGGTAFGYKVMWDEVPPETNCYDPANKLVIARHLLGPHRHHDALAHLVAAIAHRLRARRRRTRAQAQVRRLGLRDHRRRIFEAHLHLH